MRQARFERFGGRRMAPSKKRSAKAAGEPRRRGDEAAMEASAGSGATKSTRSTSRTGFESRERQAPSRPAQKQREEEYPKAPLPKQHQEPPGLERDVTPRPKFEAPRYRAAGKLEGMAALVTGGDSGIGRAVAVLYAREGADVA